MYNQLPDYSRIKGTSNLENTIFDHLPTHTLTQNIVYLMRKQKHLQSPDFYTSIV